MHGLHSGWEGGDGILSHAGMRSEVELWEQQAEREFGPGSTGALCVLPTKRSCYAPPFQFFRIIQRLV